MMLNEFAVDDLMKDLAKVNSTTGHQSLVEVLAHLVSTVNYLSDELESVRAEVDDMPRFDGEDS